MLKKIIGMFLVLFCFCILNVYAACDYETQLQISREAANVKANYEVKRIIVDLNGNEVFDAKEEDVTFEGDLGFKNIVLLSIMNLTENMYMIVQNDIGFEKTYHINDLKEGSLELDAGDLSRIINYSIILYSEHPDCSDQELRKIDVKVPMYNYFSDLSMCQNLNEYYYCQQYITEPFTESDTIISQKIYDKYADIREDFKEEEKNDESSWTKFLNFVQENIIWVIIGVILICGGIGTVWYLKKRRSDVL